jgi:hypothetical protein
VTPGHLTEFGQIVPQGAPNTSKLFAVVEDPDSGIPADAIATLKVLVMALAHLEAEIGQLNAEIARRAKENDVARRLMTVPPLGHVNMPCRLTGYWSVDRHGHCGPGPAARDLPQGPRFCGVVLKARLWRDAWSGEPPRLYRRVICSTTKVSCQKPESRGFPGA